MASNTGSFVEKYKDFSKKYESFVTKNPLLANEIEVGLKWASYIVAGRFFQSPVVTELIHSASKLLTLLNDTILRNSAGIAAHNVTVEKLKTFLTVLEYSEVFAEVAAYRSSGTKGKWIVVVILQLVKLAVRVLLLLKYEEGLHHSPPISPLNRRKDLPQLCLQNGDAVQPGPASNVEVTFTLKTSGRVMRTLDAAPPLVSRSWKLPKPEECDTKTLTRNPTHLTGECLIAEMLHLSRPFVHLASMASFGETSWKPFIMALTMDVTSLHLLRQKANFNKLEKQELNRRALSLLLYLLRSPFYDHYSRVRILNLLKSISDQIPGSGLLLRPLIEYIPDWQQLYFYAWSS